MTVAQTRKTSIPAVLSGVSQGVKISNSVHLRSEEKRASADTVDQQSASDGDDQREDLVSGIKTKLVSLGSNTGTLVDDTGVVTDKGVAGPLGEETEGNDDHESLAVALGLDKVQVGRALLVQEFHANGLFHLGIFEHDGRVTVIAIGVVVGKHAERFIIPVLGKQPTRGSIVYKVRSRRNNSLLRVREVTYSGIHQIKVS